MDEKKLPISALLAVMITLGCFGLVFEIVRRVQLSPEVVAEVLGSLLTGFAGVVGYYFGSSAGSRAKTDLLAQKEEQGANSATKN